MATTSYCSFTRIKRISLRYNQRAKATTLPPHTSVSLVPTAYAIMLRIGDYLIGDPDWSTVCGHPDIRY